MHAPVPASPSGARLAGALAWVRARGAVAAFLALALVWGTSLPLVRVVVPLFPPEHLAFLRFVVAAAVLVVYQAAEVVVWKRPAPAMPSPADAARIAAFGVLGIGAYHVCLNHGLRTVPAGTATLIINSAPIFTAALSLAALRERLRARAWWGLSLGLAGCTLIGLSRTVAGTVDVGAVLILGCAISYAVANVMLKPLAVRYGTVTAATYVVTAGAAALSLVAGGIVRSVAAAPTWSLWLVVYLGAVAIGGGYLLLARVMADREWGASHAGSVQYLSAGITIVTAWMFAGEALGPLAAAGGAATVAGAMLVTPRHAPPPVDALDVDRA